MRSVPVLPITIGLLLAFGGPPLVASVTLRLADPKYPLASAFVGLTALVVLVIAVIGVALLWERRSLSSIGLRRATWRSLLWGLGLAAFFVLVFGPLIDLIFARVGHGGFEVGRSRLAGLPAWYLTIAIVVVGTIEEILYRGYAIERLAWLSGSYWVAGTVSVAASALAHVPMWGWLASSSFVISGGALTAFYVWRRDLSATIVAHVVTDLVGIVLAR
jgi:membrane protease YdiL (CAAX protease family)